MAEDGSSSGTFGITKLNGENYQIWSFKIKLLLDREEILETTQNDPPTEASALAECTKKDRRAKQLIGLLIEDNQTKKLAKQTTAKGMWTTLQEYYGKANQANRLILFKKLCRMQLEEDGNMESHLDNMQDKIDRLTDYGHDFTDTMITAFMMGGLPNSYDSLVNALEARADADLTPILVKK